jgi:hypothetical protein
VIVNEWIEYTWSTDEVMLPLSEIREKLISSVPAEGVSRRVGTPSQFPEVDQLLSSPRASQTV